MDSQAVTYVFENGKAYALKEGKVIAADTDLDALERKVADFGGHPIDGPTDMPPPPPDMGGGMGDPMGAPGQAECHGCGYQLLPGEEICPQCGEPIADAGMGGGNPWAGYSPDDHGPMDSDPYDTEPGPRMGSIMTPNGLTGQILGRVAGIWSDEVTVRLENGRIVRLPVTKGMKFSAPKVAKSTDTPIQKLEARLASSPDGTRDSLVRRLDELKEIGRTARVLIAGGTSDADNRALDQIMVTADLEATEVNEALDHLDDKLTRAYRPPAPFSIQAADEGEVAVSMAGRDGSWLDETVNDMIAEVEATDFQQLMDEGPEAFAAGLPDTAIADTGVVRQMAASYIRSKTAGVDPTIRDPYEMTFLERVEERRRVELANRKQTARKEAAVEEDTFKDSPDDALFM